MLEQREFFWESLGQIMAHNSAKKLGLSGFFRSGLLKLLGVLTLGVFGGLDDYWKLYGDVNRRQYLCFYVFVPALLCVLAYAFFRILNVHGFLNPLTYEYRRAVLCILLAPSIFACVVGHIKRLRTMNITPWLALLNLVPHFVGTGILVLVCALLPQLKKQRAKKPRGF